MKQCCLITAILLAVSSFFGYSQNYQTIEGTYAGGYPSSNNPSPPVKVQHLFMTDNDRIAILEQQLYHEYKIRRGDTVSFKLSDYGFIIHRDHIWENVHFKIGKRYRVLLESVDEDSLPDNQMMYCTHFVVRRNQYYRVAMIDEL